MRDIAEEIGRPRVAQIVDQFYRQIRRHPTLADPFGKVTDWPAHLEHLTHFWWVTLGGERYLDYRYTVPAKHADVGFTPALLSDWLALFRQTVRSHLPGDLAEQWIERAERIGESLRLMYELGHFNNSPSKSAETVPSA